MQMIIRYILLFIACAYGCICTANVLYAQEVNNSDSKSSSAKNKKDTKETVVNLKIDGSKKSSSKNSKSSKSTSSKSSKSTSSKSSKNSSSKSSKSSKSTSGKNSKSTSKSSKNSKADKTSSSSSSVKFTREEIARYKAMPFETWDSPREISEKGLPIEPGFAQPYPYDNLMRQYNGGNCRHRGLDIGFVGERYHGMGSVVNSAAHAEITLIGKAGDNVGEFGKLDMRSGEAIRTGKKFPRQILVPGYGLVYPFSRNYGRWRSGTVIVTKVLDGRYKDYIIRYMHLGGVRPDLHVGSEVQAGEHIGIMGSTAVMDSYPHVHIDMEMPDKKTRIDPGPLIGLPETASLCAGVKVTPEPKKTSKSSKHGKSGTHKSSSKSKTSAKSSTSKTKSNTTTHKRRKSYTSRSTSSSDAKPETRVLERAN